MSNDAGQKADLQAMDIAIDIGIGLALLMLLVRKLKGINLFKITASNELFFTNEPTYFERNRLQLAFSYKATAKTTFQIGFINQFDYKINSQKNQSYLQTGVFIEFL